MRVLRKTGVRQPYQPGPPFAENADPRRGVTVVTGAQPLPAPQATWVSRLSRAPTVDWPARPAVVIGPAVPLPGATAQFVGAALLEAPERGPAPVVLAGQQLVPPAQALPIGQPKQAPDRTLGGVQVQAAPPLPPVGLTLPLFAPRDEVAPAPEDRPPGTLIVSGQTPWPGAQAYPIGRVTATPTERLASVRVAQPAAGPPGALTIALFAPRAADAPPDRLPFGVHTLGPPMPLPGAEVRRIGQPKAAPERLAPAQVTVLQPPIPVGGAQWIGRRSETPTDRVPWPRPIVVQASGLAAPGAQAIWSRRLLEGAAPLPVIICAIAALDMQEKPVSTLARHAKPSATLAPFAPVARLVRASKPSASLVRASKPVATVEPCHG